MVAIHKGKVIPEWVRYSLGHTDSQDPNVIGKITLLLPLRLEDQYRQIWNDEVQNSRKCLLYKECKDFGFENYLLELPCVIVRYITRLRLSGTKIAIETGQPFE